jgi:hypothetical protein
MAGKAIIKNNSSILNLTARQYYVTFGQNALSSLTWLTESGKMIRPANNVHIEPKEKKLEDLGMPDDHGGPHGCHPVLSF